MSGRSSGSALADPPVHRFTAMGSSCMVATIGGDPGRLARATEARVWALERSWSRFLPDSEISRLNRIGHGCLSADAFLLVSHAVNAWHLTRGLFDPTVLTTLAASGYDRGFIGIDTSGRDISPDERCGPAPGCGGVHLDASSRSVELPRGVGIDPGGLGKGLAADLVAETLLAEGADGVCISMGGDVRVAGPAAPDRGWRIGIANPVLDGDLICVVELHDHGLATSNRLIRQWRRNGTVRNHLIDPRTGASASGRIAASVISATAWWSEVLTKVAMLERSAMADPMVSALGGAALSVEHDRRVVATAAFDSFVR